MNSWFEQRLFHFDWKPTPADVARCLESLSVRGFHLGAALAGVEAIAPGEAGVDEEPEVVVVSSEDGLVPLVSAVDGVVANQDAEVGHGARRKRFAAIVDGGG